MTPEQKYIEDQMKECRERWFKDHVAVWIDKPTTGETHHGANIITWQNPQSWNYGCRFIIHRRWLCIVGDIGESVFQWSEDLTLDFLAGIDFGYFLSKCQASPEGRKFESFDASVAEEYRKARIKELAETPHEDVSEGDAKEFEILNEGIRCKDEWQSAAREYYDATGDAETASTISDMGVVPSVHAIGMFVGLQMAIAQLKSKP